MSFPGILKFDKSRIPSESNPAELKAEKRFPEGSSWQWKEKLTFGLPVANVIAWRNPAL
jgi:hypothetical protein